MNAPHKLPRIDLLSLIDTHTSPFVLIDEHYRIIAANSAYCEAYGVPRQDIIGKTCHEVSHRSPQPCHLNGEDCPHQHVFKTGTAHKVMHVHYDPAGQPERTRITGHPVRGEWGELYLGEAITPLISETDTTCSDMQMVGKSAAFLQCIHHLEQAARTDAPVLLHGESGVGKELAAAFIHEHSLRQGKTFLALDCTAIPEQMFESELFGHERGAFTGCVGRKQGLVEYADGGTLFLDEIGEMPLAMQAKLLRVLETGEFRRLGSTQTQRSDVRIISATNRDLRQMVQEGRFRQDLYYRLAAIDLTLPPLRDRLDDIPGLANTLLGRLARPGQPRPHLTDSALERLRHYHYPGNIRELRNILQKALALSPNGLIDAQQILFSSQPPKPAEQAQPDTSGSSMAELEASHIARLLAQHNGHRRTVADILGISERTLYRKLKEYKLT